MVQCLCLHWFESCTDESEWPPDWRQVKSYRPMELWSQMATNEILWLKCSPTLLITQCFGQVNWLTGHWLLLSSGPPSGKAIYFLIIKNSKNVKKFVPVCKLLERKGVSWSWKWKSFHRWHTRRHNATPWLGTANLALPRDPRNMRPLRWPECLMAQTI